MSLKYFKSYIVYIERIVINKTFIHKYNYKQYSVRNIVDSSANKKDEASAILAGSTLIQGHLLPAKTNLTIIHFHLWDSLKFFL